MSGPAQAPARLTLRQAAGWSFAFLVIAALVILYFLYGRPIRPFLG